MPVGIPSSPRAAPTVSGWRWTEEIPGADAVTCDVTDEADRRAADRRRHRTGTAGSMA
jgi:hypothetical protein